MFKRLTAWAAVAFVAGVLASCSREVPESYAPPPPPVSEGPAPVLAGGPPAQSVDGPTGTATMAPIPNPEDMSAAERGRVYGRKQNGQWLTRPPVTFRRDDGVTVVTMAPIPNPADLSAAERRRIYGPGMQRRARAGETRRYAAAPAPRAPSYSPAPSPATASASPSPSPSAAPLPGPSSADDVAAAGDTASPAGAIVADKPAKKPFEWPKWALPDLGKMDGWKMPKLGKIDMDAFALPGLPKIGIPGLERAGSGLLLALLLLAAAVVALLSITGNAAKRRRAAEARHRHGGLFGQSQHDDHHNRHKAHGEPQHA